MSVGAEMNEDTRKKVLAGAVRDEWAAEAGGLPEHATKHLHPKALKELQDTAHERVRYMLDFIAAVESYDGTPMKMTVEGLFDVLAKQIETGKLKL